MDFPFLLAAILRLVPFVDMPAQAADETPPPVASAPAAAPTPAPAAPAAAAPPAAAPACVQATELWRDDFDTGDQVRWTGQDYNPSWGDGCQSTAITTQHPHSGGYAQRSEITCPSSSPEGVHRGYGGLQFSDDQVLGDFTNTGTGVDAPNGIVTTFHTWLEAGRPFGDGRWVSLFTVNPTCGYTERVVTLGIDNADGILRPAHYWPEGTLELEPDAPAFPLGRWVRVTVYLNLHTGDMHVWQDGRSVEHVSGIARTTQTMCQWHWGLYASGDNDDVVMYEDERVVWKLGEAWTDWSREPLLETTVPVCADSGV